MATILNADTVVGGAVVTGDASGVLALQAAGNTGLTLNSSRAIGVGASPSYGTSGQVLVSSGSGSAPAWTTLNTSPSITAVASGSLSDGSKVVVNSNGTVSAVISTVIDPPTASGKTTFASSLSLSNYAGRIVGAYDSINRKVLIVYGNGSGYPTAVVGTVSGTTITFGTPVVIQSVVSQYRTVSYSPDAGAFLVAFNSSGGTSGQAAVATISGTSVSFGTVTLFQASDVFYLSSTYHAAQQKFVLAYSHQGAAGRGWAIAASISGTAVTFGSGAQFDSAAVSYTDLSYDIAQQKCMLVYTNSTNAGRALAVTVSGTSLSYGTVMTFFSGPAYYNNVVYHPIEQKHLVAYTTTSDYGSTVVLTMSGTTVTAGTPVSMGASRKDRPGMAYDSISGKIVLGYSSGGTQPQAVSVTITGTVPSYGTAVTLGGSEGNEGIWMVSDTNAGKVVALFEDGSNNGVTNLITVATSNLTLTNYIGISDAAYTNGQTATIQIVGAVDDAQSGLTAGLKYYVAPTGLLSSTDTGVFAGTAVSATNLIVKG